MDFTIDLSGIVDGFRSVLDAWTQSTWKSATDSAQSTIQTTTNQMWNTLWSGDVNIFGTPRNLVTGFPPVLQLFHALLPAVVGIGYVGLILLGISMLLKPIFDRNIFGDLFSQVLMGIFLGSVGWIIADQVIVLVGRLATTGGRMMLDPTSDSLLPYPWPVRAFLVIILLFFALRLAYRMAYRLALLGFFAPFAPIAGALLAIPKLKGVATLYWWTYCGWAAGGVLAVLALNLGTQLLLTTNGLWSVLFGIAVLGIAHDIIPWLAHGALSTRTPGIRGLTFGAPGPARAAGGGSASGTTRYGYQ